MTHQDLNERIAEIVLAKLAADPTYVAQAALAGVVANDRADKLLGLLDRVRADVAEDPREALTLAGIGGAA
jgi:hypothetical protein